MSTMYKGRVRTGCSGCRASKVKCDEQHPTCKRCTRQKKFCVYIKKRKTYPASSMPTSLNEIATSMDSRVGVQPTPKSVTLESSFSQDIFQRPLSHISPLESTLTRQRYEKSGAPESVASTDRRPPSLLSTLISQDIYICTTIDRLAAKDEHPSYTYFHEEVESPFITPYDPVNWMAFKDYVVEMVSNSTPVAAATIAVQSLYRARKNCLSHSKAVSLYSAAYETFDSVLSPEQAHGHFDRVFIIIFLFSLFEMIIPEETLPGPFSQPHYGIVQQLDMWSSDDSVQSALSLRLGSWLLISHAAARRSGNRGLLSHNVRIVLESAYSRYSPIPPINESRGANLDTSLLSTVVEPLFSFYFRLQLLSAHVADLSHYHRSRTTGTDQEEVSILMATLKSRIEALWLCRPTLIHRLPTDLRSQFKSSAIAKPLNLLGILCHLTYHTELVELGRNLSAEQVPSSEAKTHLAHMRDIMSSSDFNAGHLDQDSYVHAALLRHLFLYSIECTHESDTRWAVSQMRKIKDPICYSDFFANFAESLSEIQRRKKRRVTTKWWCWQEFGVTPLYL